MAKMNEQAEIREEMYFFFIGIVIGAVTFLYQNFFLLVFYVALGFVDFLLGYYLSWKWKIPVKIWGWNTLQKERHEMRMKRGGSTYLLFFNLTFGMLVGILAGVFIAYFLLAAV